MMLPLDTIAAVADIVTGVTCLSWLAYEWAPAIIERLSEGLRPQPHSDWSKSAWGDVPNVHDLSHFGTGYITEGKRDHA